MTHIQYRQPERHELARLAEFGAERFVDTFGHLYQAADLNAFLARVFDPDAIAAELDSGRIIWIAELDQEWIGYCKMGGLSLPIESGSPQALELKQMYVRREYHGTGVADRLMQIFLEWAERERAEELYISCWSENHRALAFYARYGFEVVAAYTFWVGSHVDDERILKRVMHSKLY